ncbi:carbon starvation CstA family protein [Cellulomonas denverensis]|uniref:Carbon starvation protein A n=1 Tax=Cellulomonas denverensis TaxID=264297 RepID=A0A7X6KS70_9CELL|nr:carbon starvation CstA family protein [Cellulomonas denverensis]NKY21198.1 carbon starvation protein A [Cellulomonas denverensis]GIG24488.1 putative carbon starvation protein (CstA) [Cellulomonas denverensis]
MSQASAPARSYTPEEEQQILRADDGVPVGVVPKQRWTPGRIVLWVAISLVGAVGWTMLAVVRGEQVNTLWFVVTAVATYAIAYRFYALYVQRRIMRPDDRRATPAERVDNGRDFDPTDRRVLYGHHFAAIAGAGPLVGPVLAAQMGYLPGTLWIIFGVVVAGGVQDMLVLFFSMRRGGRSLGQMARDEIGKFGGTVAIIVVFVMLMIVLAVLAMVCVNALAESAWGVFSVGCTIPIALLMGLYLRFIRPGRVTEVSVIGFVLLIAAIVGGRWVAESSFGEHLHLSPVTLTWAVVIYGFFAAVLPVWLLLTPRDYLSTFMKVGTIVVLALGILLVRPIAQMPAVTEFASTGEGPVFAGSLFPFLFVTIACGALSGMHAMVSSGTTPKMVQKESQVRMIGYGGMLMESFVAIMALAAAVSLNQGVYFSMNAPAAMTGGTTIGAEAAISELAVTDTAGNPVTIEWDSEDADGNPVTLTGAEALEQVAADVGEPSVVSRTGGAPTLAVGMANILHQVGGGAGMMSFWYHFAIMFEALFILSAVDAVTRVARFQLSDAIGNWVPRFSDPSWRVGGWLSTAVVVAAWGSLLLMGVTDPLGGIRTLYPLFGIANQLIAAVALLLVTVMVVRKGYARWAWIPLIPLAWDTAVTYTASYQKVFSDNPEIGYWAQHRLYRDRMAAGIDDPQALADAQAVIRNTAIQGTLSIVFVLLVSLVFVAAIRTVVRALRTPGGIGDSEDPVAVSEFYAPTHLLASPLERKVEAEFAELRPELAGRSGGH